MARATILSTEEEKKKRIREEQERKKLAGESFATEPKTVLVDIAELRRDVRGKTEQQQKIEQGVPELETIAAGQAALPQLEEAGAFEEVEPKRVELDVPAETDIPFITPTLSAASQVAKPRSILGVVRDRGLMPKLLPPIRTGEEAFPIPETPETLREAALRQININHFNEGTTQAEKWGSFMETLPGFGAIDQWVAGVVEAPFGNAEDVFNELIAIGTTATNNQEKVSKGFFKAPEAMARAREMEEEIAALEGRLKLLVGESKILQANTDQVNEWETDILDAKRRTNNFRAAARFALTAELTGTGRIVPTDEELFFELLEQSKRRK